MKKLIGLFLIGLFSFQVSAQGDLKIVATTSFLQDIAQNIAGNKQNISSLLPLGGDPHIYEPVPQDAQIIADADMIIKNGLFLEGWLNKLIDNSGTEARIVVASKNVKAIESIDYHGSPDPHVWMIPSNVIVMSENIMESLIQVDPKNEITYRENFDNYRKELIKLEAEIKTLIAQIPQKKRILITTHDAFRYYGNHFGLQVESALGTSTDAAVQIGDLQNLISVIEKNKLPAIFIESTINPKLFQQLARDLKVIIGGKLFADSLGDSDSGATTYLEMLRQNTKRIVGALTLPPGLPNEEEEGQILFLFIVGILFLTAFIWVAVTLIRKNKAPNGLGDYSLKIESLTVSYDRKTILNNIYLDIKPGKLYGIIGPNGAGKSTLFKAILDQIKLDAGSISLGAYKVSEVSPHIAYIPQKEEVDWNFPATVWDVVLMGRYARKKVFEPFNKADKAKAMEALEKVGITHLKKHQIGELSGGQQQRVFIARALCQDPEVFLMDEPFVGVDITTEEKIVGILKELAQSGKTLLIIHHDLSKVTEYFDEVIMLNQNIIGAGPTEQIFSDETIKRTYSSQSTIMQEAEQYIYK
jgi:ABC-type Mn2+/Zn2+ transport system ATPase subunit/ABC-type Zn uptake system ZnuABC Zn-binding protein ZnuA